MHTRIALTALLVAVASPAFAQVGSSDILAFQHKRALIAEAGPPDTDTPQIDGLVTPSNQTAARPRFGYRLIVGAPYNPTAFPSETWINVACVSTDSRVAYDETKFGSRLVYVHALVYETKADGSLNTATVINTVETTKSDEGICDVSRGVDTTWIEVPRTFPAQYMTLVSIGRSTQYIEVTELVERALPRR
jgi:hypothetical protein